MDEESVEDGWAYAGPVGFVYSLEGMLAHPGETYNAIRAKAYWPEGPWTKEPDAVVFTHRGLWCAVARHAWQGTLVGYVRVPKGHPWYGLHYMAIDGWGSNALWTEDVNIHGGLTFSAVGENSDTDGWYVGFDCAHSGDFAPNPDYSFGGTYREVGYVHEEVLKLARQAFAVAKQTEN